MSSITPIYHFNWAHAKQALDSRPLLLTVAAISTSFLLIGAIYRRLHGPDVLPFDPWYVTLGLRPRPRLTDEEFKNLSETSKKYSPAELACRLYDRTQVDKDASSILPAYQEECPVTPEDQKAQAIQTWAMSLQPLFAFIKDSPQPWKDVLQPIQASPRLAYTILFNCLAPFAAKAIWEGARDFLPKTLQETGNSYLQHKGKIALASIGLIAWLYYRMSQEKGIITNLTKHYALSPVIHRGRDQSARYGEALQALLNQAERAGPGSAARNIIWYYNEHAHSTFAGEIGPILGEMTATGRSNSNLEVIGFNLRSFLAACFSEQDVDRAWHDITKKLARNSNALVVLTGIGMIKSYLIAQPSVRRSDDDSSNQPNQACEKRLATLLLIALEQGKFRCLIELNETDANKMKHYGAASRRFSYVKAPDINADELEKLCTRLYIAPEVLAPFTKEDMRQLFVHIGPALGNQSIHPIDVMEAIEIGLSGQVSAVTDGLEQAKQRLHEAKRMKESILKRLWWQSRQKQPNSSALLRGLSLIEKQLLPLYKNAVVQLQGTPSEPYSLVDQMQRHSHRLFGHATKEEKVRLQRLSKQLKEKIIGQDGAIEAICEAIRRWRTVPPRDGKPLVLFFAGPSGVGKSELATAVAYELNFIYGIVTTASTNQEFNVSRVALNRSKPGGVFGWDKVKEPLLAHLFNEPTTVTILEEWDKLEEERSGPLEVLDATPIYLQGYWNESGRNGPAVDKSCAIVILTANIEADRSSEGDTTAIKDKIAKLFPTEAGGKAFLSRVDAVVPFKKIDETAIRALIKKYLNEYQQKGVLPASQRAEVEKRLQNVQTTDVRKLQEQVREAIYALQETEEKREQS